MDLCPVHHTSVLLCPCRVKIRGGSVLVNPPQSDSQYEVVVGNIGTVYSGSNGFKANTVYQSYAGLSRRGIGRAAEEPVNLLRDGEIIRAYCDPENRTH